MACAGSFSRPQKTGEKIQVTMRKTRGEPRICPACDAEVVKGKPDPCIGNLAGVSAACCGHGDDSKAYVAFYLPDGSFVAWDGGFTRMSSQELSDAESGTQWHVS